MTGLQMFFLVLLGIALFFIVALSIPVKVSLAYDNKIRISIKYLFIKINLLPSATKKKNKSDEVKSQEKKKEPAVDNAPKAKKPNPILEMVKANGHDGMITVISNLGNVLKAYGGKIFKSIVFNNLYLNITVGTGDAAATAIKYGKTCQMVFPVMGFICSNNIVKRYNINVEPDFLANNTEGSFSCDMCICVRKVINATLALVVNLIFKVLLKFILGAKNNKENNEVNTQTMKG